MNGGKGRGNERREGEGMREKGREGEGMREVKGRVGEE